MNEVFAISAGATMGAMIRWQLGTWFSRSGQLAWGTFAANALGGYGIGLALAWLDSEPQLDPLWRLFIVTGFFGALTTFSSFSAEVVNLLQDRRWGLALIWTLIHTITSISLTFVGFATFRVLRTRSCSITRLLFEPTQVTATASPETNPYEFADGTPLFEEMISSDSWVPPDGAELVMNEDVQRRQRQPSSPVSPAGGAPSARLSPISTTTGLF